MSHDGLASTQLRRGEVYRCTAPLPLTDRAIRIESVGPRYVRYREWRDGITVSWPKWSAVRRHPRVLFDSWDGSWHEIDDPSTRTVA